MGNLPIEIMSVESVDKYMLKAQKIPCRQAKRSKRHIKAKLCVQIGCKIWKNGLDNGMQHAWFSMHQYFHLWTRPFPTSMYHDMEKMLRGLCFTPCTTYDVHNYKIIFFIELGNQKLHTMISGFHHLMELKRKVRPGGSLYILFSLLRQFCFLVVLSP